MTLHVALTHRTEYRYDRAVSVGPHVLRLRPAPHCRTPILAYSLRITPNPHFINWQQDPFGNFLARVVVPGETRELTATVDLVADMATINPFDFFVEESAANYPFAYEPVLAGELEPYLRTLPGEPVLDGYLAGIARAGKSTTEFIIDLNRKLSGDIAYRVRMEPGVQTPAQTLQSRSGSCRDTGWLLVQILRRLGLATRFVSGYLIQLRPDVAPADGPAGAAEDFTDLHAWAEVYVPGAGWIGLDPTSGLLAGEGHIPLAATPSPSSAAPITGTHGEAKVDFAVSMRVERIRETPRVTQALQRRAVAGDPRRGRRRRRQAEGGRRAPQRRRRADLRRARRRPGTRVEHRRPRSDQARVCRQARAPPARAAGEGRPAALRPGQVVSRRADGALGLRHPLAGGRRGACGAIRR